MKKLKILFENNEKWVQRKIQQNPEYFKHLAKDQDPSYLWIGCSDSRVPANQIVGLEPGELVVHRNVANIFPHTDFNCLSVLEFAVNILKVSHIIVCGHYGCGGVKAAMEDHHLGLVDNWLRNIRDVYARNKQELDVIEDQKQRYNRLAELNVMQQVMNICHTTIVQEAWFNKQPLSIHGWIYDLESGRLRDLKCCFSDIEQVEPIYRVQIRSKD
ncbi:MAG: carbonate dehydratase [Verrucomicrobia bacterium]|nr:carbonate dehydratase [Verrucomicrobiota bacterium]MBS0647086.1 carbonate dehydratase [Verrucomicrobiota bacterium]